MGSVENNLNQIKEKAPNTRILAVSKYVSADKIIEAYNAGLRDFAESKTQDSLEKMEQIPDEMLSNITWHFIGHLQTNKVKKIVGVFDYIHSVDSFKLAEVINAKANEKGVIQKIFLQVNNAEEESKFGFSIEEVKKAFAEIIKLDHIKVSGLMNIAPLCNDKQLLHKLFREIRELKEHLEKEHNYQLDELSMGMSEDYEVAIEEGSTIIRIGNKLFN